MTFVAWVTLVGYPIGLYNAASNSGGNIDPLLSLTQYGPLGLMVLGFLTGWIVPGPAVKAKDAEIKRLQALFEEQVVPMTQTYATTMLQATKVMDELRPLLVAAVEREAAKDPKAGR